MSSSLKIRDYLRTMVEVAASDLHLRAGSRPVFRVNGKLMRIQNSPELTAEDTAAVANELLDEK